VREPPPILVQLGEVAGLTIHPFRFVCFILPPARPVSLRASKSSSNPEGSQKVRRAVAVAKAGSRGSRPRDPR